MKKINFNEVSSTSKALVAGGYICKITSVEDMPNHECLKIQFDIADGEFKDYAKEGAEKFGFWGLSTLRSYKQKALGYFKQFLICIEKSNKGFSADNFDCDEMKLVGKYIGFIIGIEEYVGADNKVKTRPYVAGMTDGASIKKGDFTVPELKRLSSTKTASVIEDESEDFPF